MFLRDHTATGLIIGAVALSEAPDALTAALWAAPVALLAHVLLDLLDEHDFGLSANVAMEGALVAILGAIVAAAGLGWPELGVLAAAAIAANLPDITDSNGYLTYVDRKRWPHRRWWFCHKTGYPIIQLGPVATVAVSIGLAGATWFILIRHGAG